MNIKTGTSLFGWAIFLIFSSIVVNHAVDHYRSTSEIEWIPLLCIAGLGLVGGCFQFLPSGKQGKGTSGGSTLVPPNDNGGDAGGF